MRQISNYGNLISTPIVARYMYICMYVCIYVCMYVCKCIYIYMYIYMYIDISVCVLLLTMYYIHAKKNTNLNHRISEYS
jgi:hypothetical protein